MREMKYLTQEQYEVAKLQAVKEVSKILDNTIVHTINGLPESVGFQTAYNKIMAGTEETLWNMMSMYEYGRAAGIKAERERRKNPQKREELKKKYPEMAESICKVSKTAIEMVGILETMTDQERNIFIKHFENRI